MSLKNPQIVEVMGCGQKNLLIYPLSAQSFDDLKWEKEIHHAQTLIKKEQHFVWHLEFGFSSLRFDPHDTAAFFSFSLAVEEFAKTVLPLFKEQTFGVCFYRGGSDLTHLFLLNHWEETFEEWCRGLSLQKNPWNYSLFCTKVFGEFLQRLLSFLPEEVLGCLFFDISNESSWSKIGYQFNSERFELFELFFENKGECFQKERISPLGICLPVESFVNSNFFHSLDHVMGELQKEKKSFRLIPEAKLTEEWNGLDQLIIFPTYLSAQGKRKVTGFEAAGGQVLSCVD